MSEVRRSAAATKRLATEHIKRASNLPELPTTQREMLERYRPNGVTDTVWEQVRPVVTEVLTKSCLVGDKSFQKHLGVVASYVTWLATQHRSMAITEAFTFDAIDQYYLTGLTGMSKRTCNDYRSRLQNIAKKINTGVNAPSGIATPLGHISVRPGYTPAEEATLRRIALRQSRPRIRTQLCAIVGFGAGAGLDSVDLRNLHRHHIDVTDNGIVVNVTGRNPRQVIVRATYEELVLVAIEGLTPKQLVVGIGKSKKNPVAKVIDNADLFDDTPPIDMSRLRSTWISWLMTCRVPLGLILQAAGLRSARTLTDLLPHLEPVTDTSALRDGGVK
jgi:hypothetical protein